MIIVTGAGGKTGQEVIRALSKRSLAVRAIVFHQHLVQKAIDLGAQEALQGDLRDIRFIDRAFKGVRAVYHICPNIHPEELVIARTIIQAAQRESVRVFAYHSVLHPHTEKMVHHWQKLRVEELLFESDLPFIVLQPAPYMQNLLAYLPEIKSKGIYAVPYRSEAGLSMIDLADLGEAAAVVLSSERYIGGVYELVGMKSITQKEIAFLFGQKLGRKVTAVQIPLEQWRKQAAENGLLSYQVEALSSMFRYYDLYGLWGNKNILTWLLGREPTTLNQFMNRELIKL